MSKEEFIEYISINNAGFYKTRRNHIKNISPNILDELDAYVKLHDLHPLNFNDSLLYYLNDITTQNTCVCGKTIHIKSVFCSNKCAKENIHQTLSKTRNTLLEKYGQDSPLKIAQSR